MALLSPRPIWQELDGSGRPCAGGLLYTYENGTSIPKATYDKDGNIHANPIVFDSEGRATIRLGQGLYSMTFSDGAGAFTFDPLTIEGVVIWATDNIGYSDSIGLFTVVENAAALVALAGGSVAFAVMEGYTTKADGGGGLFYWDPIENAADGGVYLSPTSSPPSGRWVRQYTGNVNPRWWGAVASGSFDNAADDEAAFAAAVAFAVESSCGIDLDYGTYCLSQDPGLTLDNVPVFMYKACIATTGFVLALNPVIAISDTDQHFLYYNQEEIPLFPSDTEGKFCDIKNAWLGITGGGWYQTQFATAGSSTDLDTRVDTLETQMVKVQGDIGPDYTGVRMDYRLDGNDDSIIELDNRVHITENQIAALNVTEKDVGINTYGAVTLTSTESSGKSSMPAPYDKIRVSYEVTTKDILLWHDNGDWSNGNLIITVTGDIATTVYTQAYVAGGLNANMGLMLTQLQTDVNFKSVTMEPSTTAIGNLFTFLPISDNNVSIITNTTGIVGTPALTFNTSTTKSGGGGGKRINKRVTLTMPKIMFTSTSATDKPILNPVTLTALPAALWPQCPQYLSMTYFPRGLSTDVDSGSPFGITNSRPGTLIVPGVSDNPTGFISGCCTFYMYAIQSGFNQLAPDRGVQVFYMRIPEHCYTYPIVKIVNGGDAF